MESRGILEGKLIDSSALPFRYDMIYLLTAIG